MTTDSIAKKVAIEAADRELAVAKTAWEAENLAFGTAVTGFAKERNDKQAPAHAAYLQALQPFDVEYLTKKATEVAKLKAARKVYEDALKRHKEILEANR